MNNKILIIEDNLLNLELATDLLESNGFMVYSTQTAEEGLRMAGQLLPDLVIMDFSLPGMDGLTATKKLKANPATCNLTVVGLTANAMKGDEELAMNAGCNDYLTKPIDTRTFASTIKNLIASTSSTADKKHPIKIMQNEIHKSEPVTPRPDSGWGLVLVVDDEIQNRTLLRDPMEAFGYRVEEAESGMQALEKIADRPPDVILLDLMMPKMDGFEVCRKLKVDLKTAHIPILMLTALSERGDRLLGIRAGANDFLTKPIDVQDVLLRVGNAVRTKQLYDQLKLEQEKSERLLLNILPKPVAERMKKGEVNIADSFTDTTVLVADLVGFTTLSAHIVPEQIVQLLNEIFSAFDLLTESHGLEKIKTIGDAYMAAGGISILRADHAEASVELALAMQEKIGQLNQSYNTAVHLRIGICTGPVVAGVIGSKRFAYDLWGETVNLACRLESTGKAGKIQVSESTYERLKDKYQFEAKHRIAVKGYDDQLSAYWLDKNLVTKETSQVKSFSGQAKPMHITA